MNKIFLLFLFPFTSYAQTGTKEFKIKGELKLNKAVDWVYLRYNAGDQSVFDSIQPKNGEFKFEGRIAEPTPASLSVKFVKQAGEEKIQRDGIQIFLEPGKLEFLAKDSLKINSVTGSQAHLDFADLNKQLLPYNNRLNPLYDEYRSYSKIKDQNGMQKIENEINAVQKEIDENVYASFVKQHPSSPVALYALKQYAGWDIDPNKVEPLFNVLPAATQKLPSAVALKGQIEVFKKTAIGKTAMDFTQNDTLGNPVSLSSFRGKYVLVDFWASWCGPCRQENPNVVKAFNKYKDKNFTIIGVSLDRPNAKDKWLKAIHDDGLTWNHVSDLKYWDNEVAKQYAIRAIPQNLLIDPQGKIVARNLNGESLDQKLAEYLSK